MCHQPSPGPGAVGSEKASNKQPAKPIKPFPTHLGQLEAHGIQLMAPAHLQLVFLKAVVGVGRGSC